MEYGKTTKRGEDWFNEMEFANEKFSKENLKGLIRKYSRKFLEIFMDPGIFSKKNAIVKKIVYTLKVYVCTYVCMYIKCNT